MLENAVIEPVTLTDAQLAAGLGDPTNQELRTWLMFYLPLPEELQKLQTKLTFEDFKDDDEVCHLSSKVCNCLMTQFRLIQLGHKIPVDPRLLVRDAATATIGRNYVYDAEEHGPRTSQRGRRPKRRDVPGSGHESSAEEKATDGLCCV